MAAMTPSALRPKSKSSRHEPRTLAETGRHPQRRRVLITGGAGFLGVNAAVHLIEHGWHATVLDNLSRSGTDRNLKWLLSRHAEHTTFVKEDIRNAGALDEHVKNQDAILH